MLAKAESIALVGTDAHLVQVEVDVASGVPRFTIVGLPAASVREAAQRTRSAVEASGEKWPSSARIVANLAPGALRKEGTHFDLPIALGVLAGTKAFDPSPLKGWVAVGELALDGSLRPVRGTLAAAMACRRAGRRGLICPAASAHEARLVDGIEVVPASSLGDCLAWVRGGWSPPPLPPPVEIGPAPAPDIREVRGCAAAKRALEIAGAGGHNAMLCGPPGSGKTMLASRLPGVLPEMTTDESLEVTRVYSVAGLLPERATLIEARPFRVPHHHTSLAGLVGGGSGLARPGELSLAHCGVLFLDELPLYRREVLDALRAPVEEGVVRIARSGGSVSFPCRVSLVAAMNPCPCGFRDDPGRECRCDEARARSYQARISGPMLDRFDMFVWMRRLRRQELLGPEDGEASAAIRARVERTRAAQRARYGSPLVTNATAPRDLLADYLQLSTRASSMLGDAIDALSLTGRGLNRVLRIARTIADLAESASVSDEHVSEALALRLDAAVGVAA